MFEEWAQQYFDHLHYSAYRTLQADVSVLLFLEIKKEGLVTQRRMASSFKAD